MALTKAQSAWLERQSKARVGPGGEFTNPYHFGFEAVTWRRMAKKLEALGYISEYTFGGYLFTPSGRTATPTSKGPTE